MMCELYASEAKFVEENKRKTDYILKHFDESISEETEKIVIDTVFKRSRYIFIRKEKYSIYLNGVNRKLDRYYAYCTHCKEEYEVGEHEVKIMLNHNTWYECDKCKSKALIKHIRYKRSKLKDTAIFITYDKSKVDNETIVARGYLVTRDYSGDYKNVTTEYNNLSRYAFTPKGSFMITNNYWCGWYIRDRYCSYKDGYGNYSSYVDYESIERAVKDTRFKYSPYKLYMNMAQFFYNYNKYPIVEKLIKIGFKYIADCVIYGDSLERAVRWKQTDVFKFLGLNRAEVREIKENGVECTPKFLNIYKFSKQENLKWDIKKIKEISSSYELSTLKKIKKYAGITKTISYLNGQLEKRKDKRIYGSITILWFDYLKDCEKLSLDMKSKKVLYPKDLDKEHQNTIKQVKYFENKLLDEEMKTLAEKREKYYFEYKELFIRAALSTKEIIDEGSKLSHCVGGYIKSHAEGKTNILFIREKDSPDVPFYTVEVKDNKIIQVHGLENREPIEEVKEFINEFKKEKLNVKDKVKVA